VRVCLCIPRQMYLKIFICYMVYVAAGSQDSSVSIVNQTAGWTTDISGFDYRENHDIFYPQKRSNPTPGPTKSPARIRSKGAGRPGRETDHSPQYRIKVKTEWSFTFSPPYAIMKCTVTSTQPTVCGTTERSNAMGRWIFATSQSVRHTTGRTALAYPLHCLSCWVVTLFGNFIPSAEVMVCQLRCDRQWLWSISRYISEEGTSENHGNSRCQKVWNFALSAVRQSAGT
jgi:hypothetical protein